MASIKDVAKAAQVSTATVSYVLNNSRRVTPEVRRRVLAAVDQLGYRPSMAARQLASGKSQLLAMIISDIRNPFFPEITTEFQDQAIAHGLDALIVNTNYDASRTRGTVDRLLGLGVPGIAVMTSQIHPTIVELLAAKQINTVYLDLGRVGDFTSNILVQYELGVRQAIEYLRDLGHRRIGFLGGPAHLNSAQRRKSVFFDCVRETPGIETRGLETDFTVEGGYYACSKLLTEFHPDAIFCGNDLTAIGALHCAFDRQVNVPAELSIVGFDDISFSKFTQPALTSVAVPRTQIGSLAFQAIWNMLNSDDKVGVEYVVTPSLVVRASCTRRVR